MPYLDVLDLLKEIYSSIESVEFIKSISIRIEGPILKSRLIMTEKAFIDVFFNSKTKSISFTLVKNDERIFGIDRDSIRDWHKHPFGNPNEHIPCNETNFTTFLEEVKKNLNKLK